MGGQTLTSQVYFQPLT